MIRVLIADDHKLVRGGLRKILLEEPDIQVVAEAETSDAAAEAIRTLKIDVALLDISMPGKSGLEVLADLKPSLKHTKVLILTMYPERLFALRAIRAGASGYLTKESAPDELVSAVRKVAAGGRYVTSAVADQLADALSDGPGGPRHTNLSPREMEVLRLIASGAKTRDIAEQLSLAVPTVNTYRSRILEKLSLKTTSDLIRYALEHGLVV